MSTKTKINAIIRYGILVLVGFILVYPLLWMVGSAFKENIDIFGNLNIFPPVGRGTTRHFPDAWQITSQNNMAFYYLNTLRFVIPRVIGQVISCTLTAYAIARYKFPGKKIVLTLVIITLLMPDLAFRIPLFMMFRDWGILDSFLTLYIQEMFAVGSFFVFMILQFMRTIPTELDEASYIDGCNAIQTLVYVLIPILRPILITVALLTFMWGMNDFQGPLIFLNSPENRVLAQALSGLMTGEGQEIIFGRVFAGAFMAMIPTLAIFFAASKFFVDGIASSGGKE
ncbi:MAG: carbohydrate ABC transporter permease [Defluviitaleaceae bacterium]|nr:carbohydrate ABC transporter permease [Defluviitaleaceae bacterium]